MSLVEPCGIDLPDDRPPAYPAAPCNGCGTRSSCRDREVACEQFALYAQVGGGRPRWEAEPRQPSQVVYDRIFTTPFRECGALTGMSIDDRRAAAKRLSARGHNQTVISQLLGVGKTTVRKDLAWPNEPPHRAIPKIYTPRESKWLIGRRAAVRGLAAKGHTRREIAELLGIDKQRVNRDLRRAHATARTAPTKGRDRGGDGRYRCTGEPRLPVVRELAAMGHSAREIAGIVGVHLRTVFNDLKLLGGRRVNGQTLSHSCLFGRGTDAVELVETTRNR